MNNHICHYVEVYRAVNSFEPSITNVQYRCKDCDALLFASCGTEEIKNIPIGELFIKGESEEERKKSLKKSISIRNKKRLEMGLEPLGDDGFVIGSTPESRRKSFEELLKAIGS